ncbi:hypothetical protein F4859DRAFT_518520 [Xylaria cf. heliscus]|nr:hypothetical protein F4859DRAFT_518520 [Xylaria cf. heliscus]
MRRYKAISSGRTHVGDDDRKPGFAIATRRPRRPRKEMGQLNKRIVNHPTNKYPRRTPVEARGRTCTRNDEVQQEEDRGGGQGQLWGSATSIPGTPIYWGSTTSSTRGVLDDEDENDSVITNTYSAIEFESELGRCPGEFGRSAVPMNAESGEYCSIRGGGGGAYSSDSSTSSLSPIPALGLLGVQIPVPSAVAAAVPPPAAGAPVTRVKTATAQITIRTGRGLQRVQLTLHDDWVQFHAGIAGAGSGGNRGKIDEAIVFHFFEDGNTWRSTWLMRDEPKAEAEAEAEAEVEEDEEVKSEDDESEAEAEEQEQKQEMGEEQEGDNNNGAVIETEKEEEIVDWLWDWDLAAAEQQHQQHVQDEGARGGMHVDFPDPVPGPEMSSPDSYSSDSSESLNEKNMDKDESGNEDGDDEAGDEDEADGHDDSKGNREQRQKQQRRANRRRHRDRRRRRQALMMMMMRAGIAGAVVGACSSALSFAAKRILEARNLPT